MSIYTIYTIAKGKQGDTVVRENTRDTASIAHEQTEIMKTPFGVEGKSGDNGRKTELLSKK